MLSHGVSCPKLYYENTLEDAMFPVIARPFHHFKGKGFYICNDIEEARKFATSGHYIQEYITNQDEYRIYILLGKVFESAKKVARPILKYNDKVRNFDNGWTFRWTAKDLVPPDLTRNCIRAAGALRLQFCAIDCCIAKGGMPYVFEANTAPSLNERKPISPPSGDHEG